jgi:hypothetical protein
MPTRTQTSKRPSGGRFGRPAGKPVQQPARGRFGRPAGKPVQQPARGRFGRPAGKPAQRPARARRTASSRLPAMATRRRAEKSGVAKAAQKLGGLIPGGGGQKRTRGAAGGRSKRGAAGLALLAGAAGLAMKNRDKLKSMVRGGDSSHEASHPVEPQPLASTPAAPETNTPGTPLSSTDHPPA